MKTIEAKLSICKNKKTINEIVIKPTIEDDWNDDKVRKFIREAAKLDDDDFSIVDLNNPNETETFVSASHFIGLDPNNKNYHFRIEINDKTPKLVFSSNATIVHEDDEYARDCLNKSISLAERLMATDSYARHLKVLNQDIHKFSEMLSTTEVFYYDFNQYQEEEEEDQETFDDSTEGDGNGLSLELMQTAAKMLEEWKKNKWIAKRTKQFKDALKKKIETEVHAMTKVKHPAREISSKLSKLSREREKEWRQKAETEWKNQREECNIDDSLEETEELDDNTPLAWTKRRTGNHCKTIYINEIFIKRLRIIREEYSGEVAEFNILDDSECLLIIVAQAFAIIHETAHLSLRWKGFLNTPCCIPNQREAGDYLESSFFNFLFSLLVERVINGVLYPWDETQTIKGIGVINYGNKSQVIRNVEESYIKQVCEAIILRNDSLFDDSTFYPIQCTKKGHDFGNNVAVTKGKDDYYCNGSTSASFYEAEEAKNIRPVKTCGLK